MTAIDVGLNSIHSCFASLRRWFAPCGETSRELESTGAPTHESRSPPPNVSPSPAGKEHACTFLDCTTYARKVLEAALLAESTSTQDELQADWNQLRTKWTPLIYLTAQFSLTDLEAHTLALGLALEHRPDLFGLSPGNRADQRFNFATALKCFEALYSRSAAVAAQHLLAPSTKLVRYQLFDLSQPGNTGWMSADLHVQERIYDFALHLEAGWKPNRILPAGVLRTFTMPLVGESRADPDAEAERRHSHDDEQRLIEGWAEEARHAFAGKEKQTLPFLQLLGRNRLVKLDVVRRAFASSDDTPPAAYLLPIETLLQHPADGERFIQLWAREQRLLPHLQLIVDAQRVTQLDDPASRILQRLIDQVDAGPITVFTPRTITVLGRRTYVLDVDREGPPDGWRVNASDLDLELDGLAQRGTATDVRLKHVILPPSESQLLQAIASQIRCRRQVYGEWGLADALSRGRSITALFSGESGTGKTMAAQALANEVGMPLFCVDLSAVHDKYVGETEKHLRRIFDTAHNRRVIFFFDEADTIFAARSEVRDSHDRFANLQANYLLQRFEQFEGVAILATNRKQALDYGFRRRIRHEVLFNPPGADEREAIWRQMLCWSPGSSSTKSKHPHRPPPVKIAAEDLAVLRQLNIAGGTIRCIVTNTFFIAAERGAGVVELQDVYRAAEWEYRKLDRLFDWPAASRARLLGGTK